MRISRMLPQGHPAAAQQIARRTPQINAGVAVGVVNRSARGIYYWSVETTSTVVFVFGVRVRRHAVPQWPLTSETVLMFQKPVRVSPNQQRHH